MSPRPQIDHIRRPQLLAAAAQVIAERGLANTRISDVAERAGSSPPAVVYWFGSKDELLLGAIVAEEDGFYDEARAALEPLEGGRERLERLIDLLVSDSAEPLWIELWPLALRDARAAEARVRLEERWRGLLGEIIRRGLERGEFDVADPHAAAVALGALTDGLAIQATLGDAEVSPERLGALMRDAAGRLLGCELRTNDERAAGVGVGGTA
ncbi:TetR family transcriptional regulator [Thermoleophilia bacterium SCSIO 60948]|nr:TetR family transcriptional regulator [Thermoleophilia bacterium SCSIO 60948]